MIDFTEHSAWVGNFLNQNEALLIGYVLNFKMVNAIRGLRRGAGWLRPVVVGPAGGYIRSQNAGMKTPQNRKVAAATMSRLAGNRCLKLKFIRFTNPF